MRKAGYIRDNGNDPEIIDQQKKALTQARCDEVIVERVTHISRQQMSLSLWVLKDRLQ